MILLIFLIELMCCFYFESLAFEVDGTYLLVGAWTSFLVLGIDLGASLEELGSELEGLSKDAAL